MAGQSNELTIYHDVKHKDDYYEPLDILYSNPPVLTTVEVAVAEFNRINSQWLESPCRARFLEVLSHMQPRITRKITKAVSFAIGPITQPTEEDLDDGRCRAPLVQLVVFLDIVQQGRSLVR